MSIIGLFKLCRCGRKIEYGKKYCNECSKKVEQEKAERNRVYDKTQRKNSNVYSNKIWKKLTEECKNKFNGSCIYSYYVLNKIEYGSLSHHIETIEDNKDRAFDLDNLIYVSRFAHDEIHKAYNKSNKDKKDMQQLLLSLIKRYKEEFGD